jgi:hypothetical protein
LQRITHSRSHYYLCHIVVESLQALELRKPINGASIFNANAEELVQNLDLLSHEVVRWKRNNNGIEVRDSPRAYLRVLIVDIFFEGLYDVYEGELSGLKL